MNRCTFTFIMDAGNGFVILHLLHRSYEGAHL